MPTTVTARALMATLDELSEPCNRIHQTSVSMIDHDVQDDQ
jgi:hypothetical protein